MNIPQRSIKGRRSQEAAELSNNTTHMKSLTSVIIGVLTLATIGAGGAAAYFYNQLQVDPEAQVQEEVDQLVERVGKLFVLPEDERPTVATISDIERLREQPFFARGKNGDRVLIYTSARKAILYDPVANKIVEVAPLNIGTGEEIPPPPEPVEPEEPEVPAEEQ